MAELVRQDAPDSEPETATRAVDDLVVVAEFRDPIYPGLVSTGKVAHGGDKPFHTVINAENFHALQALLYTHEGKVDAIYIDPPYNTGARDWKYNNDYVDGDDAYRHSKWLAMMERRLKLAKRLLNSEDSVLIVTIDEKEVHRLALLLEQIFPSERVQMVTIVINAPGQSRKQELARVEEYAFFVFFGAAQPASVTDDLLNEKPSHNPKNVRWESLLRSGTNSRRADRPALFYPAFINPAIRELVEVGDPKSGDAPRDAWQVPPGLTAVWPLKSDGSEGNWRASSQYLRDLAAKGFVRLGQYRADDGRAAIWYLGKAAIKKIDTGEIIVTGRDPQGAVMVNPNPESRLGRRTVAKTVWNRPSHHAGWHGSALLRSLVPGRSFPFPKALYSVEDALRLAIGDKPEALTLDFFAGSGTTAHATMRLNRQDGGRRQSVSVTNNEVGADEQKVLRDQGFRPGDAEWEKWGICDNITRPRIEAAITGKTPDGDPIKGDYKFADEFPKAEGFEENVEYFTMTYEAPRPVAHDRSFDAIAPLLWLKAGAQGRRIEKPTDHFDIADTYGVLFDLDRSHDFVEAIGKADSIRMVYLVTDDDRAYQAVCAELPAPVDPVRLYESYLTSFTINTGKE